MALEKRNGIYYARFQVNGKKIRRSLGKGLTHAQAKQAEATLRLSVHNSGDAKSHSFEEGLLRWIEGHGVRGRSTLAHARQVRPYFAGVPISEAATVSSTMKDALVKKGLAPSTVNNHLVIVKRVLNLAYKEWGWIDQPLADRIKKLSTRGNARHVYLTTDEVQSLVDSCGNANVKNIIQLAAYTGLRRGELLALKEGDFVDGCFIVRRSKSGHPRVVPVPEHLHDIAACLPCGVTIGLLQHHWRKAKEATGLDVRFHDLRHTYASWLVSNPDVPLGVVRDLMGHHDLSQTSRYAHLRTEALKSAVENLQ